MLIVSTWGSKGKVKFKLLCFKQVCYNPLNTTNTNVYLVQWSTLLSFMQMTRVQFPTRTNFENTLFFFSIRGHQHTSLKLATSKMPSASNRGESQACIWAFMKSYLFIVDLRFIEQCPILPITSFASFIVYFLQLFLKSPSPKVVYTIQQYVAYM